VMTWSKANDRVRYYDDGVNYETDTVLGVWAGALAAAVIGATTAAGLNPYYGKLAHVVVFGYEPTPGTVADLAMV